MPPLRFENYYKGEDPITCESHAFTTTTLEFQRRIKFAPVTWAPRATYTPKELISIVTRSHGQPSIQLCEVIKGEAETRLYFDFETYEDREHTIEEQQLFM